ncbi:MAG: hypothetical protein PUC15_08240 [Lentisphaeria bacterium]|nr:hypothetical protein [Lentisphaeria bacterium]
MTSHDPSFTVNVPPAPGILHPVLTRDMAGNGRIHVEDLALRVHSARVAAADELFDCLEDAVKRTCEYCLEGNLLDSSHAGEFCPFSRKEPCFVQKWKDTLKLAGQEQLPIIVNLKRLNKGKRHAQQRRNPNAV